MGIAAKLQVPAEQISLIQHEDGLLSVTVGAKSFTGTMDEIWQWLDSLTNDYGSDFSP